MRKRLKKKLRWRTFQRARFIGLYLHRYDDAIALVNHFLRSHPKDTLALSLKGNLLDVKGSNYNDYMKNVLIYEPGKGLDVDEMEQRMEALRDVDLPRVLSEEEEEACYEEALSCYQKILSLDPKDVEAMVDIGDYWERKESYAEALRWYDRAIAVYKEEMGRRIFRAPLADIVEEREEILNMLQEEEHAQSD